MVVFCGPRGGRAADFAPAGCDDLSPALFVGPAAAELVVDPAAAAEDGFLDPAGCDDLFVDPAAARDMAATAGIVHGAGGGAAFSTLSRRFSRSRLPGLTQRRPRQTALRPRVGAASERRG